MNHIHVVIEQVPADPTRLGLKISRYAGEDPDAGEHLFDCSLQRTHAAFLLSKARMGMALVMMEQGEAIAERKAWAITLLDALDEVAAGKSNARVLDFPEEIMAVPFFA